MKSVCWLVSFFAVISILLIGCTDKTTSPVAPVDQNFAVSLDKKGPIVHAAQGTFHLWYEGKHISETISAHKYQDGTVDGTYLINAQNAFDSKILKWNGEVLFIKTYENFGQYNGKMAVIGGSEKNTPYAGWYDIFFVIDNSPNGPNETSYYVYVTPDPGVAESIWNLEPDELVEFLYGILPVDNGHLTVY